MRALFTFVFLTFFGIKSGYSQAADTLQSAKFQTFSTTGVKIGINISSLDNFNNRTIRIGLAVGLAREFRFSKLLGIATELNYSQHGSILQHSGYGPGGITFQDVEYGLNYLTLPVLLSLHDNDLAVQAGAYGAVLLKAKVQNGKITEDITEHVAQTETGLCIGLTYHFWGNTVFGLRYYRGLHNLNKSIPDTRLVLRNSTLQITGGYTF